MRNPRSGVNLFCILFWMFGLGCGGAVVVAGYAVGPSRDAETAFYALLTWLAVLVLAQIPMNWIHNWDIAGDKIHGEKK